MIEKTKLKITTVTPVTIGSGAEWSPYRDYVVEKVQICFIDEKKIAEKLLAKGEQYFDKDIYGVVIGMEINGNNRSEFDLKSFLLKNRILQNIAEVVSSRCALIGKVANCLSKDCSKLRCRALFRSQQPKRCHENYYNV